MIPIDLSNQLSMFSHFLKDYCVHSIKLDAAGKAKKLKMLFIISEREIFTV